MVPAGSHRSRRSPTLAERCSSPATRSSTAATPTTATTSRRAGELAQRGHPLRRRRHERRRVRPRARLLPDDRRRGRGRRAARADLRARSRRASAPPSAHPAATGDPAPDEQGYLHCGPDGAGHFVKMVHNGIEYGLMAAYAEGLNILHERRRRPRQRDGGRRDRAARPPRVLPVRHRHRRGRRGVAARQRGRVVAARPHRGRAARVARPRRVLRPRVATRARAAGRDRGRDRRGRARAGAHDRAVRPLQLAGRRPTSPTSCCRRCASSSAATTSSPGAAERGKLHLRPPSSRRNGRAREEPAHGHRTRIRHRPDRVDPGRRRRVPARPHLQDDPERAPAPARPGLRRPRGCALRPARRPCCAPCRRSSTTAASPAPATCRSCPSTRASSTRPARRSPRTRTTSTRRSIVELADRGRLQRRRDDARACSGLAARRYAHRIPFLLKLNHNEFLTYPNAYDQIMFASVQQAREHGLRRGRRDDLLRLGGVQAPDPGGHRRLRGRARAGHGDGALVLPAQLRLRRPRTAARTTTSPPTSPARPTTWA